MLGYLFHRHSYSLSYKNTVICKVVGPYIYFCIRIKKFSICSVVVVVIVDPISFFSVCSVRVLVGAFEFLRNARGSHKDGRSWGQSPSPRTRPIRPWSERSPWRSEPASIQAAIQVRQFRENRDFHARPLEIISTGDRISSDYSDETNFK